MKLSKKRPNKARCIQCLKEFRSNYGFHVSCKACRTEQDHLRAFEWALKLCRPAY